MRFASQLALSSALVSSLALFAAACTEKKTESAPAPAAAKPAAASAARALEVPRDRIWAASAHVRVIDTAAGQVVGGIQLQKAIDDITFTADGHRAFIAASDGVRVVDVDELKIVAQLTTSPARQVLLSPDGKTLGVLEHDVNVAPNGVRTPSPFRWKTIDVDGAKVVKEEVVGDRVLGVIPGYGVRSSAIMFESGDIGLVPAGKPLLGGSVAIDLERGVEATAKAILTPRPYWAIAADQRKAWMPVEGAPSRVIELDLERGTTRGISLGAPLHMRGLAVTADGSRLVVNASNKALVVELAGGVVLGQVELGGAHLGAVVSPDGRRAYLAQTIHEKGGAVSVVELEPLRMQGKIHIDDISPWVIGIAPRTAVASAR